MTRDTVISRGNVGRFQVNASVWHRALGYPSRAAAVRALQDRHANIRAGVAIQAYIASRHPGITVRDLAARYNGSLGTARGERYADRVEFHMRRRLQWARQWERDGRGW